MLGSNVGLTKAFAGLVFTNDATVTTIKGIAGDYLRIGDAGTTGHSLNSEDDLLVTGELEVDGAVYLDSTLRLVSDLTFYGNLLSQANDAYLATEESGSRVFMFKAANASAVQTEVARLQGSGDPSFEMGGSQQFKFYNSGACSLARLKCEATAYTASGVIGATVGTVELNQSGSILAMTLADPGDSGKLLVITQIDTGTQGHTVTGATAGAFNGTDEIATFNAQFETLVLYSVSSTRWVIVENIGAVGLST